MSDLTALSAGPRERRLGPQPETPAEARDDGVDEEWRYWEAELQGALRAEKLFRDEGETAEEIVFGPDTAFKEWGPENTHIITSTVETLKPLIYSETPTPICDRTFRGDGGADPVERIGAEIVQRIAKRLIDGCAFDSVAKGVRDDWLIPGRGDARVIYRATWAEEPVTDPATGQPVLDPATGEPMMRKVKSAEKVYARHWPWRRMLTAPSASWEEVPWKAYLSFLTRKQFADQFPDIDIAEVSVPYSGRAGRRGATQDKSDSPSVDPWSGEMETIGSRPTPSNRDSTAVYEIWVKEGREVLSWSPSYKKALLRRDPDPHGFEEFWDAPAPLLAHCRSDSIAPRSRIAYMKGRSDEIDEATRKLNQILKKLAVVGFFPGAMSAVLEKALDGTSKLVALENWAAFIDRGGAGGGIQWLPIDAFVKAATALITMRDQAKLLLFEQSGVSDIARGQGDPNETATAQSIKGKFMGLRMGQDQRSFALFLRDLIDLMVMAALEHYDLETIIEIANYDLPASEAERTAPMALHQQAEALWQQDAAQAQAMGAEPPPPLPPPPEIPEASWETVEAFIRDDFRLRYSIVIETDDTLLVDEEADRKARVEFLTGFVEMVNALGPLVGANGIDLKLVKELLLFGVRGFRKARTLEGMIAGIPDELPPAPEAQEDVAITVAKIRAQAMIEVAKLNGEVDITEQQLENEASMAQAAAQAEQAKQMKGLDLMVEGERGANRAQKKGQA